eukprot:Hpha_TRINITY_DN20127_c0_g1::TRINITY_DN20127_c0_g1_i1::g.82602::m.82602
MAAKDCWIDTTPAYGAEVRFSGAFRSCSADFEVTEIGPDGSLVRVGSLDLPPEPEWVRGHRTALSAAKRRRREDAVSLRAAAQEAQQEGVGGGAEEDGEEGEQDL